MSQTAEPAPPPPVVTAAPKPTAKADPTPTRRPFGQRHPVLRRLFYTLVTLLVLAVLLVGGALVAVHFALRSDYPRTIAQDVASSQLGLRVEIGGVDVPWFGPTVVRDLAVSLPLGDEPLLIVPVAYAEHPNLLVLAAQFLVTGNPPIDLIAVRDPVVTATQDVDGEWNVLRAIEAVQATQAAKPKSPDGGGGVPPIPAIKLVGGTVTIRANAGPEAGRPAEAVTIQGLQANGEPSGLRYAFAAGVPGRAVVGGKVVPGGDFRQEVAVAATDVDEWVKPFLAAVPENAAFVGRWSGRVVDGGVQGRLKIDRATFADATATGTLEASAAGDSAVVDLRNVVLNYGDLIPGGATVTQGTVTAGPEAVTADAIRVRVFGGVADVTTARYALAGGESATASVEYRGLAPAGALATLDGTVTAGFSAAPTGGYVVDIDARGTADLPQATADYALALDGRGEALTSLDLTARLERLFVRTTGEGGEPVEREVPTVTARAEVRFDGREERVTLKSLSTERPGELRGRGEYVLSRDQQPVNAGYLTVGAVGLPVDVPRLEDVRIRVDAGLDAWVAPEVPAGGGEPAPRLTVKKAYALTDGVWVEGAGSFFAADPTPVRFTAVASRSPGTDGTDPLAELLRGTAYATASGGGTVDPVDLDLRVDLFARDLTLLDEYALSAFDGALVGDADDTRLHLASESPVEVLGGTATVEITNPYSVDDPLTASLVVDRVAVPQAGALVGVDGLRGTLGGRVDVTAKSLAVDEVEATARFQIPNFELDAARVAEVVTLDASLSGGVVTVDPLLLETTGRRTADQPLRGDARVTARLDLADLNNAQLGLTFNQYTAGLRGLPVEVVVNGGTPEGKPLFASLSGNPEVNGKVNLTADVDVLQLVDFARATLDADAEGRALVLNALDLDTQFGGEFGATGRLDLDRPEAARLDASWDGIDLARIGDFAKQAVPDAEGLAGTASGGVVVGPSSSEQVQAAIEELRVGGLIDAGGVGRGRPLGPLAVVVRNRTDGGRWREVEVGGLGVVAYVDLADRAADLVSAAGSPDAALDAASAASDAMPGGRATVAPASGGAGTAGQAGGPSTRPTFNVGQVVTRAARLQIAGGEVDPFFRVSLRPGARVAGSATERDPDEYFAQGTVAFSGLQVGPVVRSVAPEQDRVQGELAGNVVARGSLQQLTELAGVQALAAFSGSGRIELSKAELGGVGAVDKLVGGARSRADEKAIEAADARAADGRGRGTVRFRVEGDTLTVQDLSLLVQGIEIKGAPVVRELSQLPDSPLDGFVAATARPLADTRLPFLASADDALAALQSTVTAFKLKGTLADLGPDSLEPVSLAELGGTLKDIFGGGRERQ